MSEWLSLLGSMGSMAVAVWIWRFSKVAMLFRYLAVVVGGMIALSIIGIISIQVHPERVLEIGEFLWQQLQRWVL